jgi:hypothetical protein
MPKRRVSTPVKLFDFDRLTYEAKFTTTGTIEVQRVQPISEDKWEWLRGAWEFKWTSRATWECFRCESPSMRAGNMPGYSPEFVPEAVVLKVRDFIAKQTKVVGRPKTQAKA